LIFLLLNHSESAWSSEVATDATVVETLVVIGSHAPVSGQEMTSQVSVISRAQIEALNRTNLQQLIDTFTGLSINQQGGAGGATSLYVRGGEANFAVVLIDGVRVNNPVDTRGGSFDFSTLDPSQVERIELIRGPQSALYGADALSGVLNIVTRTPTGSGVSLALEGGQHGYYRGHIHAGGELGGSTSYSVNLGRSDSGDIVEDSERQLNFANAGIDWQLTERGALSAGFRFSDSDRKNYPEDSGGPEYAVWDALDEAASKALTAYLGWRSQASERWHYQVQASWNSIESMEDTPGIFPGFSVPPRSADVDFDRYQLTWNNQLRFERLRLGLGIDAQREDGDSQGEIDFGFPLETRFSLVRDSVGGFIEAYAELNEALAVSASLRYDDVEQAGSERTGRLGVRWQPAESTTLRANWGEGFKPPSFFALAHPLVGNPDLNPERSESWELGLEQHLTDTWSFDLVYFDVSYRDLIDFDDALFMNVNRDRVDAEGIEFSTRLDANALGGFRLHATWTDTDIASLDQTLRGRPEWKWGVQWLYDLGADLGLTAEYMWVDEVTEASRHTGDSVDYRLDAYSILDVSLNWHLNDSLIVRAVVENLLDEDYQQAVGFPAPGRFLRLGVEWRPGS
jgi:iron complex outermembrane receptor protein/vitamin B12 transporter